MVHDVIATCPVCSGELTIARLHCRSCGTSLEGEFGVGRFGRLDRDQMSLLESFLRSRGNLKEMERELGISYPTVRGRVDALIRSLGLADGAADLDADAGFADADLDFDQELDTDLAADAAPPGAPGAPDAAAQRRAILERLARKEMTADEAATALRELGA
jgi:hypothetical protein